MSRSQILLFNFFHFQNLEAKEPTIYQILLLSKFPLILKTQLRKETKQDFVFSDKLQILVGILVVLVVLVLIVTGVKQS